MRFGNDLCVGDAVLYRRVASQGLRPIRARVEKLGQEGIDISISVRASNGSTVRIKRTVEAWQLERAQVQDPPMGASAQSR